MRIYNYFKSISQEITLKIIDEKRNCFLEETEQNELMSRKYKKVFTTASYIEHLLILTSLITGCISVTAFDSLFDIPVGITSSTIGLKTCAIAAEIKRYNSITKKKKKKHDKIMFLAKSKLNSVEVRISKTLIDSNISHDEFVLIKNVLKEYDNTKEEIKYLRT